MNNKVSPSCSKWILAHIFVRKMRRKFLIGESGIISWWPSLHSCLTWQQLTALQGHQSAFFQVAPCSWAMLAFPKCVPEMHTDSVCCTVKVSTWHHSKAGRQGLALVPGPLPTRRPTPPSPVTLSWGTFRPAVSVLASPCPLLSCQCGGFSSNVSPGRDWWCRFCPAALLALWRPLKSWQSFWAFAWLWC